MTQAGAYLKQADEKYSELAKLRGAASTGPMPITRSLTTRRWMGRSKTLLYLRQAIPSLRACLRLASRIFQGHLQHAEQVAADLQTARTSRR